MEKKLIRLSKCSLKNSEYAAVIKVLKSDYLGMGPVVKKFENIFSEVKVIPDRPALKPNNPCYIIIGKNKNE